MDGLTKALTTAKHKAFIETTSLEDQGKCLTSIRKKEDRRDVIQRQGTELVSEAYGYGADAT